MLIQIALIPLVAWTTWLAVTDLDWLDIRAAIGFWVIAVYRAIEWRNAVRTNTKDSK